VITKFFRPTGLGLFLTYCLCGIHPENRIICSSIEKQLTLRGILKQALRTLSIIGLIFQKRSVCGERLLMNNILCKYYLCLRYLQNTFDE